jgi:hypothetical protein
MGQVRASGVDVPFADGGISEQINEPSMLTNDLVKGPLAQRSRLSGCKPAALTSLS